MIRVKMKYLEKYQIDMGITTNMMAIIMDNRTVKKTIKKLQLRTLKFLRINQWKLQN